MVDIQDYRRVDPETGRVDCSLPDNERWDRCTAMKTATRTFKQCKYHEGYRTRYSNACSCPVEKKEKSK